MPNIEVHGLGRTANLAYHTGLEKDIPIALIEINDALSSLEFKNEVVITIFDSYCIDMKRTFQPFIRIYDTDIKRAEIIASILHNLQYRFDIEIMKVEKFVPDEWKK